MTFVHDGIGGVVAGRAGVAAVFPLAHFVIVDAEVDLLVVALGLVATGARFDGMVHAATFRRVVFAEYIADDIVYVLIRVDPSGDSEVLFP